MTRKLIFFWGREPLERKNRCLSQWWPSRFVVDDVVYEYAEQFMMAQKALLFGDLKTFDRILRAETPDEFKSLGRKAKGFDAEEWEASKVAIVFRGNLEKFRQNEKMGRFLISTGQAILVESSPTDFIWGIGLSSRDERAKDPTQWRGSNLLGFTLMAVREALK